MKPAQKLDAGFMNDSREQILFRQANRIWMALSPWKYQQDADEGAGALYSLAATKAADLVTLADWHQIDGKGLYFMLVSKFKESV